MDQTRSSVAGEFRQGDGLDLRLFESAFMRLPRLRS